MIRYSEITEVNPREIVLLKSFPCSYGKCSFCDYIADNDIREDDMVQRNREVLSAVTGRYGQLEVINSASVFELPEQTKDDIAEICREHGIHTLYFESYYSYRKRLDEIRKRFAGIDLVFKCGIETFDDDFRNRVLKKGVFFKDPAEVAEYFTSICLLVGIRGQTKDMLRRDIDIALRYFPRVCINLFQNNTTAIREDRELQAWFLKEFAGLKDHPGVELLVHNTDFGVGGEEDEA